MRILGSLLTRDALRQSQYLWLLENCVIENNFLLMYVCSSYPKRKKIEKVIKNLPSREFSKKNFFKCLILREMLLFIAVLLLRFIIGFWEIGTCESRKAKQEAKMRLMEKADWCIWNLIAFNFL